MRLGQTLSTAHCKLCSSTDRTVVGLTGRGGAPLLSVLCDGCGLISHDPVPTQTELDAFYASRYRKDYKGGWTPKPKHSLRAQRSAARRAARLAALVRPGARVLDVGASSGEFVYMMQALGFDARGIEPNDGYRQFGIQSYGIDVTARQIVPEAFGSGVFDLIALNHVYEHLADPLAVLECFQRWLAPGGMLFIEVPDTQGVQKQRGNLFHYAHVWNFTPRTLVAMLARGGFAPLAGERTDTTSIIFVRSGKSTSPASAQDRAHADAMRQQLLEDQSAGAYLASGAPLRRRWARLKRNVDEIITAGRFGSPRAMADAVLAATPKVQDSRWVVAPFAAMKTGT
ncbi:MAG: class I SAM-dependent methyltransferase [Hyphomonadaceae bacterium]|nr:class I SAM-dependent methyltransferase [Hyphomonadaceae bacterium]